MSRPSRPEAKPSDWVQPIGAPEVPRTATENTKPPGSTIHLQKQSVEQAATNVSPHLRSPLGVYIEMNSLSEQNIARVMGVALLTAQRWCRGEIVPTLAAAIEIERITKGVVPVEAWCGLPRAQETIRDMRTRQPAEMQNWKAPDSPVGQAPAAIEHEDQRLKHNPHELESEQDTMGEEPEGA